MAGILSTAGTAAAAAGGPVGVVAGTAATILGGLNIGSKYTKDTFVQRFVAAQNSGDDHTAGALIDQAVYHGFIQGVADAGTWKGLLAAVYQAANVKWKAYVDSRLAGSPAIYDIIGSAVTSAQSLTGVTPNAAPTSPSGGLGQQIADFLGIGKTAQQAATAGGTAAGQQIGSGIVKAALVIGGVVLVVVLIRSR